VKRVTVGITVHAAPARLYETLAAVERSARRLYEVLLLGDGPDAETAAALAQLRDVRQSTTDFPAGAPACFNRLAVESDCEAMILLESGAIPAPGALDMLIDLLARDRRVGLAGPSTNHSWNEQSEFPVHSDRDTIMRVAREAARRYGGVTRSLEPLHSLADFCLAVRRDVIEAIGGADEKYGLGPCWELEYNVRAARAGFRGVWVCGAYVWRAPFTGRRRIEEERRFDASRRRYQDSVCGLRLRGQRSDYESHCRGEECEHFAPPGLIRLQRPLPRIAATPAPAVRSGTVESRDGTARRPATSIRGSSGSGPLPLVSCVMPTRGRPDFLLQAVRLFERQDYPNRELIIAGEPADDLESLVPAGERIRHLRCPSGESIGAKRNRACAAAAGAYIAQWDDDDWYGPSRLSAQLTPLVVGRADITGLRARTFFELPTWQFWTVTPALHARLFAGDVHGGTLVFGKRVWQRVAQYPDASLAEDAAFLLRAQRRGARLERLDGAGLFIYLRHADNAWRFRCGVHVDRSGWRCVGEPPLPAEDHAFYADRSSASPRRSAVEGIPLVSCLMPTRNRRRWITQAISYFRRQDYPNRELLILDDGEDAVADLIPPDYGIRYVRLDRKLVLGEKRNHACELARGEIIAHWDDDDWQAPNRLSYQVSQLERHGASLCGPSRVIFFEPASQRAWQYEYPRNLRRWVAGGAMCYRKEIWREHRFAPVQIGEDTSFVANQRGSVPLVLDDDCFFVALMHPDNTSRKITAGSYWRPRPVDEVRALLGEDFRFYAELDLRAAA
jgi:glycosyltransferase involved in cell wall biosynthesis/GT2 family glycosyltransferase